MGIYMKKLIKFLKFLYKMFKVFIKRLVMLIVKLTIYGLIVGAYYYSNDIIMIIYGYLEQLLMVYIMVKLEMLKILLVVYSLISIIFIVFCFKYKEIFELFFGEYIYILKDINVFTKIIKQFKKFFLIYLCLNILFYICFFLNISMIQSIYYYILSAIIIVGIMHIKKGIENVIDDYIYNFKVKVLLKSSLIVIHFFIMFEVLFNLFN